MSKVKQGRAEATGVKPARADLARVVPERSTAAKAEVVQRPTDAGKRPAKVEARSMTAPVPTTPAAGGRAHARAKAARRAPAKSAGRTRSRTADKAGVRRTAIRANGKGTAARPAAKPARTAGRVAATKPAHEPERVMKIRELIPQDLCGKHTSVEHLFRVDERNGADAQTHLVFHDRHGWYCYHGPGCHAVGEVRKVAVRG